MGVLAGLDSLGGAGGLSSSSSAAATGGTIGAFNFNPKSSSPWLIGAVVVVGVLLLAKQLKG